MKSNKLKLLNIVTFITLLAVTSPVLAKPDTDRVPATNNKSNRTVTIPEHAVQIADNVFSLGAATDPTTGKLVEGFMIIDNQRGQAKGGVKGKPDKPGGGGEEETCFTPLAKGARWKQTENYIVAPSNSDRLTDSFVQDAIATATSTWNNETSFDIFGPEDIGTVDGEDTISPDGKNEVLFDDIANPEVIGVTIVWGIFRGKPDNRELVEWDQVYDDIDFNFGDATVDPLLMDFLNVAVHEAGHAAGLGHPSDSCAEESMYRFVTTGETKKRDLNTGDVAGINALYL